MKRNSLIICRGGGDLATGIAHRLHRAGFRVLVLETDHPAAIRRQVSFCEAVYEGKATVEGVTAQRIDSVSEMEDVYRFSLIPKERRSQSCIRMSWWMRSLPRKTLEQQKRWLRL